MAHGDGSNPNSLRTFQQVTTAGVVKINHNGDTKFETTAYGTNTIGTAVNDGMVIAGITTSNSDITVPTTMDSTESGGVAVQRFWSTGTITAGNVYKCGKWYTGEGTIQLLIAVRSHTAGNSGTTTYMLQGSFSTIGSLAVSYTPLRAHET